ncbi:DUF2884 family protein [Alteromonas oceanisediminis]|uniref:DUF2884 family protein n=1 Tax=Alteromonas oceanisediminis TaxID=2836180 RepID=UPI001BDB336B|nr:DUF2884 family protein [Alteromonas oceanisediminis]MBT0585097.1 DUF2884 family protein [Alteromonas oceanisediminis]
MKLRTLAILIVLLIALPYSASAGMRCTIDFNYGLVVNNSHIRVMEESRTVLQINNEKQLFIGGRLVPLDTQQELLLKEYAEGLHYVVPKMIIMATEGIELAIDTIDQVYQGIVGAEHGSYEKLQKAMDRARDEVRDNFRHASNHYFIGPGSLEQVDDFVDQQIEAQLGEAISTSLGGILSVIGGLNSADGNTEERMQALSERLEQMSVTLDNDVGSRANNLRDKAKWFCAKIEDLNRVEEKLHNTIPAFSRFDVIVEND